MALPIAVHNVLFRPDDRIEITYQELREQSDSVNVVRTVVLEREEFEDDVQDVESNILDLLDNALTALRNPPDAKAGRASRE